MSSQPIAFWSPSSWDPIGIRYCSLRTESSLHTTRSAVDTSYGQHAAATQGDGACDRAAEEGGVARAVSTCRTSGSSVRSTDMVRISRFFGSHFIPSVPNCSDTMAGLRRNLENRIPAHSSSLQGIHNSWHMFSRPGLPSLAPKSLIYIHKLIDWHSKGSMGSFPNPATLLR